MMLGDENKFLLPQNSTGFTVGWRYWFKRELRLQSLTSFGHAYAGAPSFWEVGKPMVGNPDKKGEGAMMGVYAMRPYHTQNRYYLNYSISGFIALWGVICTGARGFRAQYGYPLTLDDEVLANTYNCEYLSTDFEGKLTENEAKEYLLQHKHIWLPANVKDFPKGLL